MWRGESKCLFFKSAQLRERKNRNKKRDEHQYIYIYIYIYIYVCVCVCVCVYSSFPFFHFFFLSNHRLIYFSVLSLCPYIFRVKKPPHPLYFQIFAKIDSKIQYSSLCQKSFTPKVTALNHSDRLLPVAIQIDTSLRQLATHGLHEFSTDIQTRTQLFPSLFTGNV